MNRVLRNGRFYLPGNDGVVESSLRITAGKISALGEDNVITSEDSQDLQGAYVYPGLIESHVHIYGTGLKSVRPTLEHAESVEQMIELLRQRLPSSTPWILGRGWDNTKWSDPSFPTAEQLDNVSAEHPIVLTRIDGHAIWCNSKALELSDVTSETADPPGGKIMRASSGKPTGVLLDEAMKLVESNIPPESADEKLAIIRFGLLELARCGHVAVHDMGVSSETWSAMKTLYAREGDTLPRAYIYLDMHQPSGRELFLQKMRSRETFSNSPHERLCLTGIKIYLDGALGSRGASLFQPYSDDPGNLGLELNTDEDVLHWMTLASDAGLAIAVHAIGDKANNRALDLFERSGAWRKSLCRIEHAQIVQASDVARFARMKIHAVIQPRFYQTDHVWATSRLGEARMRDAYRWKSLIEAGVSVIASSDSPIEPPDPANGVRLLCGIDVDRPDEVIKPQEAIDAYTLCAAKLIQGEQFGRIAVGAPADLTIFDGPVTSTESRVLETIVAGKTIWRRDLVKI